jgi:hypothetical protein
MRRPFHRRKFEANYAKMARRTERTFITMDVIYGLPADDLSGFEATLDYVMSFDHVRWILTNPLILLPGSEFHRDREKHGIVLRDEESFIVESTATFSREDMAEAILMSFRVSVVFFNERLRDALKAFAKHSGLGYVAAIRELFQALPFSLLGGLPCPYLVPSVARDFRDRNLAIHRVVHLYPSIVRFFDDYTEGKFGATLAGYEDAFVPQYHRLARFAEGDAARAGLAAPDVPELSARPPRAARSMPPAPIPAAM